ncbi:discoidin domain-containing protein [Hyalangium versicolor]|uniref:discoidin domain-containing protein n=1 Tax=Hyalangium versicolor TaxID=2861190 RepID=UPI002816348C|nr:discoidin domain-containing protein [Hyalangium versicolor]
MKLVLRMLVALIFVGLPVSTARAQVPLTPYSVAASSSYSGAPPQYAVDGNPYTAWNSGVYASAQPFLQIDLGGEFALDRLELRVAQYPSGSTSHQVVGYTNQWVAVGFGTYSGFTADGMLISYKIYNHTPVRYIRIITTASPSWVAWSEVRTYRYVPSGTVTANRASCSVPYNGTFCDSAVRLSASIPTGEYGRVWVAEAAPGAPELGGWVFDTYSGYADVGWIRAGTYKFELREGANANGAVISSVYVSGVKQQPPPAKFYGYFGAWEAWNPQATSTVNDTIAHSNLIWAAPGIGANDVSNFKAMLNRPDVRDDPSVKIVLDGTNIFYGEVACPDGSTHGKTFFDGANGCTPRWPPSPMSASERYGFFLQQLTAAEYQKIAWVFPVDEPDLISNVSATNANLAAVKQILADAARARFGSGAIIPKMGLMYSYLAVPMYAAGNTVGAASADAVAYNCYPISYLTATSTSTDACGRDAPGVDAIVSAEARFNRLKQLVPGKKYFLTAETAIPSSQNDATKRGWLAENFKRLRKIAQNDSSVEGVIGFNWRGLNMSMDGAERLGPPSLTAAPDFRAAVINEGMCLTHKGAWQCAP